MKQKGKRNIYTHEIELQDLELRNCPREKFRDSLEAIPYRGYRVERISDGREVVITKPGGKQTYGRIRREDFMVWILDPRANSLWLISHKDIHEDLEKKAQEDKAEAVRIIEALERVFVGEDPDDVAASFVPSLRNPVGELPEVLLKAYKWIWGQEDCNYPEGQGRDMSMKAIRELKERLTKTP